MTRSTFGVPEIHCDGCATSIRKALEGSTGVRRVEVDVPGKKVHVEFDEAGVSSADVRDRIEGAGFDVASVG